MLKRIHRLPSEAFAGFGCGPTSTSAPSGVVES
jgi:hypothetical protein